MVGKVARAFGPAFEAVWFQRYDLTLLAYLSVLDLERLDGTMSRHRDYGLAVDVGLGLSKGSALKREVDKFEQSLQRGPRKADTPAFDIGPFLGFPGMPNYKKPVS